MSIIRLFFRSSAPFFFGAIVAACSGFTRLSNDSPFTISPEFQAFYLVHEGARTIGPPISGAFRENDLLRQCFVGGCLEYHPQVDTYRRVMLSALPNELRNLPALWQAQGASEEGLYFPETGYSIQGAFRHFFETYGGAQFFGFPLSSAQVRSDTQLVQYFERAILVWDINLPQSESVQLAPVGSFIFDLYVVDHTHSLVQEIETDATETSDRVQEIVDFAQAHGGRQVFGRSLGPPHVADDGVLEQVYANAVLVEDPDVPYGVSLRPLGRLAHGSIGNVWLAHADSESINYSDIGPNIPAAFRIYYTAYGGEHLFGQPISEAFVRDGALVQYFENVQMIWEPGPGDSLGVSLGELGILYSSSKPSSSNGKTYTGSSLQGSSINVYSWVSFPFVLLGEMQEINVMVTDGLGQVVPNALVTVELNTAQGVATFPLSPSGRDGRTSMLFPVLAGQIDQGWLVTYNINVRAGDTVTMISDSFHVVTLDD